MPSRGRRVKASKIAPKINALTAQGLSRREIAAKLKCSETTVSRVRREFKATIASGATLVLEIAPPKKREELSQEVVACLEDTADGFERFYNRYNSEYRLAGHMKAFVAAAIGQDQCVINVPPGHAKSTTFSIWLPIWEICKNPDIQILSLSKAHDLSLEFCRAIAWELENNPKLVNDFGRFKPESEGGSWSPGTGKLMIEGRNRSRAHGPTFLARGAGQQVYGFRADLIIADDLVDVETVRTPELRKKTSEWYHVILHSRRRVEGRTWVIGTRFHPEDIYGELVAQTVTGNFGDRPLYKHINFPALRDPDTGAPTNDFSTGLALWPEEWPAEKLRTKVYEHVGSSVWGQTYQQVPLSPEDVLARPEWVYGLDEHATPERRGCLDLTRNVGVGSRNREAVRVISVDPSPTKYVGIVVADVVPTQEPKQKEICVIEIVRDKMLQRDLMDTLDRMIAEHRPVRYVIIEVNAFARWFTQDVDFHEWSKRHNIRVISHTTGRNKTDAEMGLESLSREFEFGRIRLPYADPFAKNMSQLLIKEATEYTPAYKGTTDVLMATWFISFNRNKLKPHNRTVQAIRGWAAPRWASDAFRAGAR